MALNLEHRVYLPQGAAGQRWPAMVMVHGWLGNEHVMSIFDRTVPANIVRVSPRGPLVKGEQSFGWYSLEQDPGSFAVGLAALTDFVRALPEVYPIDPQRVLLMGFSQGAAMCYALLLSEPALAVGVAGMASFLPEPARPWATPGWLSGQPVFMAHGTQDETVPVAQARAASEALRAAGAEVDYHEYEVGHKMSAEGMRAMKGWVEGVIGNW